MSGFASIGFAYEPTGFRTDHNSRWRKLFGENPLGHYWGRPIVRVTEGFTFKFGNVDDPLFKIEVKAGFQTDLGTAPGPLGSIIWALAKLGLIKENLDMVAVLHDLLWWRADKASPKDAPYCYWAADVVFLHAMIVRGQPKWFAKTVYNVVRTVGKLKLFSRKF